jgi:hypothetical protein
MNHLSSILSDAKRARAEVVEGFIVERRGKLYSVYYVGHSEDDAFDAGKEDPRSEFYPGEKVLIARPGANRRSVGSLPVIVGRAR